MLLKLLCLILASNILIAISAIHIYWAMGGKKWGDIVIPKVVAKGEATFKPGPIGTLMVAVGLLAMVAVLWMYNGYLLFPYFIGFIKPAIWLIIIIFLLRAIGDFKYVGLFKKIKDTDFAYYDTRVFTPLCLLLAGLIFGIATL